MRSESEINAELAAVRAEYHEKAATLTAAQVAEVNAKVRALSKELQAVLTAGAKPCPVCDAPAHGMLKRAETPKLKALYEVGCLNDGCRAQGATAQEAIDAWNKIDGEAFKDWLADQ